MQKKIFFILMLFIVCLILWALLKKRPAMEPIEIEKQQLKLELMNTQIDDKKKCRWNYGFNKNYHLFYLTCVPSKTEDQGSFFTIEKKYKINKANLIVKNTYTVFGKEVKIKSIEKGGGVATPIRLIKIDWN